TPYEVLAGVSIRERNLWPLIQAVRTSERNHFGMLLSQAGLEPKGSSLLGKKNFEFSAQAEPIAPLERTKLAHSFLQKNIEDARGHHPRYYRPEFTAFGQAIIDFVREVFTFCQQYDVKAFASMISCDAPQPRKSYLRKDYAFLLERYFYYLEDILTDEMGLLVFDEHDKAFCKRLIAQMEYYFNETFKGRARSIRIVPEPFFVHSDITTAVQVADLVAYSLNWGLRMSNKMDKPTRSEIEEFGQLALKLEYTGIRDGKPVYGIKYIDDLRPRDERN
ncbi:MAG: DUF3800 domain-containing protein, partial [Chloroflexi bacterium]